MGYQEVDRYIKMCIHTIIRPPVPPLKHGMKKSSISFYHRSLKSLTQFLTKPTMRTRFTAVMNNQIRDVSFFIK
jgi:hypothetical protein